MAGYRDATPLGPDLLRSAMTVTRLRLIHPSFCKCHIMRSLSTFSGRYCSARLRFSGADDVGARNRHGAKRPIHRGRAFHMSSMSKEAKEETDHYRVMKVPQNATPEQIKQSYFKLSKMLHPDALRQRGALETEETKTALDLVCTAYNVLKNPVERREYDLKQNAAKAQRTTRAPRTGTAATQKDKPFDVKSWWERYEGEQTANKPKQEHGQQAAPEEPYEPPPPYGLSGRAKRRRERKTMGEPGAGAHGANQRPLEMGFRPRSSWDPRFAKFFDDWMKKMKEQGWDPSQTTAGPIPGKPGSGGSKAAEMMDGNLMSEWIKHARKEGKDPMGTLFSTTAGRGSATGVWLKNRMAALDREEAKKTGGAWERGGVRRGDGIPRTFTASWGKGPAGSKRPVYSSDGPSGTDNTTQTSGRKGTRGIAYAWNAADGMQHAGEWDAARNLGGAGTGEETFNAPWDSVPGRGFQKELPRPWWAAGPPPEGKNPHANDTWKPDPKLAGSWGDRSRTHPSLLESTLFGAPPNSSTGSFPTATGQVYSGPVKRDYSKGHQLDERYEEDKLRMAANERRMLTMVGFAVALGAVVAAGRAAGV